MCEVLGFLILQGYLLTLYNWIASFLAMTELRNTEQSASYLTNISVRIIFLFFLYYG